MPRDLAIITELDQRGKTGDFLRGTGATDFVFEPFQNDIQFDRLRLVRTFAGTQKLVQSIMKILLTTRGEYIEDPLWGTLMNNSIGSKFDQAKFAEVRQSIIDALIRYNEVNQDNPDPDEVINTIDEITVVEDLDDPRVMRIVLVITTESGKGVKVLVPQVEA